MDFTREPMVQTVITPREGHKIVIRSSKNVGQEEYFVDSLELVSFGEGLFFRSKERPKPFLVPASDYEVIEVREAKMVLKNVGIERSIKIAGGKEKEPRSKDEVREADSSQQETKSLEPKTTDRKRDRRRDKRRRHQGDLPQVDEGAAPSENEPHLAPPELPTEGEAPSVASVPNPVLSALLKPPPTLISETLRGYRENALFKEAFYSKEELDQASVEASPAPAVTPDLASFESALPPISVNPESENKE